MLFLLACTHQPADSGGEPLETGEPVPPDSSTPGFHVTVAVTLDGEPTEGITVLQGGSAERYQTDVYGMATLDLDTEIEGIWAVVASHPEARTWWVDVYPEDEDSTLDLALERYDPTDNLEYAFRDPGEPDRRDTTNQCAHCHVTINEDWIASPHASSASNPDVQAVYAQLPEGETGQCADCHAPGIDGALGGRDLAEAEGMALDHGVHCDVCHRVESVDLDSTEPGVGGKLVLHRPSEAGGLGFDWKPLVFGPFDDVPSLAMGSVQRDLYAEATICAGCHEHDQPAVVGEIDPERWPSGRIPVHSTYSEWREGPLGDLAACQSCHMPPDPDVGNSADLGSPHGATESLDPGVVAGWYRSPGSVRRHTWYGPRQPESRMLELAASLSVSKVVDEGTLTVEVTTKNVGPGHAIPTGEPSRNLILLVDAACDEALVPTGGDVVPDYGGSAPEGSTLRLVEVGDFVDYEGPLDFGGRFSVEERGLRAERFVAEGEGLEPAEGQVAYVAGEGAWAGRPGFGWARVLADAEGNRMVPHWAAVDVVSDNRLMPQQSWTTTHTFAATCEEPTVTATLVHRAYPYGELDTRDQVMAVAR